MTRPILIIEDDPDIAEDIRYNLEARRFETRVAHTGKEGLAASLDQDRPPLLILLDQLLPEMNGLDIRRRIRRDSLGPQIPIDTEELYPNLLDSPQAARNAAPSNT